jgi:hypothetical protein
MGMSNSCFYCGEEFALPHQRMVHEERCGGESDGSDKDVMFRYSEPMKLAYRLLKVDDDDDEDVPPEVLEALLAWMSENAQDNDGLSSAIEDREKEMERQRQMDLGLHSRPYANITTEELHGNLLWMIHPEHAEERQQVMDELNLRSSTSWNNASAISEKDVRDTPFDLMSAPERMSWQDEMKGEPMDVAWQLLKDD